MRNMKNSLTERQYHIAMISISTALSANSAEKLQKSLSNALEAGLTINEINEEIAYLYAYLGFAPSCRAAKVFMDLVNERARQGKLDIQGREANLIDPTKNKYARGEKLQMFCTGLTAEQLRSGFFGFNSLLDFCLKEHLFADLFARDLLSPEEHEITTVSALAAIGEPLVEAHFRGALNVGVSREQIQEILELISDEVSVEIADIGQKRLEITLA